MTQKYYPSCGTCTHEKAVCRFCVQQSKHSDYYSPEKAFQAMRNRNVEFGKKITFWQKCGVFFFSSVLIAIIVRVWWLYEFGK